MSNSQDGASIIDVVVVMTCHNRVSKSTRLVDQVRALMPPSVVYRIVAVDDGSSDGTGDALRQRGVEVIKGNGSLFWARGMARAIGRAEEAFSPKFTLWVNDDLDLHQAALAQVADVVRDEPKEPTIFVGQVSDPRDPDRVIYGLRAQDSANPLSFPLVHEVKGNERLGVTFNGNFVLVPRRVSASIKFPGESFQHAYADLLYGLRATRKGYRIVPFAQNVGLTSANPGTGRMFDPSLSLSERMRFAMSPFGLPPRDHWKFAREVGGFRGPELFVRSYGRVLFPRRSPA